MSTTRIKSSSDIYFENQARKREVSFIKPKVCDHMVGYRTMTDDERAWLDETFKYCPKCGEKL